MSAYGVCMCGRRRKGITLTAEADKGTGQASSSTASALACATKCTSTGIIHEVTKRFPTSPDFSSVSSRSHLCYITACFELLRTQIFEIVTNLSRPCAKQHQNISFSITKRSTFHGSNGMKCQSCNLEVLFPLAIGLSFEKPAHTGTQLPQWEMS